MQDLRGGLSDKNPYKLSKHRFYELKHYCLQYEEWRQLYHGLLEESKSSSIIKAFKEGSQADWTSDNAVQLADLYRNIRLVEDTARRTEAELWRFIFAAVTQEKSYNNLRLLYNIPCGRDYFYNLIRKFYWLLSEERGL